MKLKYMFMALAATLVGFTSCSDDTMSEQHSTLSDVQVSSSYIALPADGGSYSITINAASDWTITAGDDESIPEWLTITPTSGTAGEATVTFSAEKSGYRETMLYLTSSNGQKQYLKVFQGTSDYPLSTCAEVIAGANSDTYRVKGTCTKIVNTTYGNWYLNDGTGEVYIYGTLDAGGGEKNFSSLGIESGDIVEVQGPKTTYGTTIELVNVTVLSITKSLIKVDSLSTATLPKEGGEFTAYITNKGDGITVNAPEWLSVKGIKTSGTTAEVTFKATANEGGLRTAELEFTTTNSGKEYNATTEISQEGSIVDASIAEFNAAEVGSTQYRLSGVVTSIKNSKYGNFYIKDHSGETYIYGLDGFAESGIDEGDIVTIIGQRGAYGSTIEVLNASLEDKKDVQTVTVAEFLAKEESSDIYYKLTGNIANIKSTTYGNYDLVDETGSVYIYGTLTGWNGASKQFESLGLAEGDNITLITVRAAYNGTAQGKNAIFVSKN